MTGRRRSVGVPPAFLTVGALSTAVDLALTAALTRVATAQASGDAVRAPREAVPPFVDLALADLAAVTTATAVSAVGHRRRVTDDPVDRWYRHRTGYGRTAVASALVDSIVFATVARSGRSKVVAKAASLSGAFVVRLWFYRRLMFHEVRSDQEAPSRREPPPGAVRLSVVVPAFGEEHGIGGAISRLRSELADVAADGGLEVVVVDDGSADDTAGAARAAGADQVIRLPENRGKGAAVRVGMLAATGRTIAFTDADLSYSPHQIAGLLEKVEEGWDVVVGSRRHTETKTLVAAGRLREIGGRVINVFTMLVLLGQYRDTQCGLKAFRSDVARDIFGASRVDGFAFDVEVFHLVERHRYSLVEVPVELANSNRSTVHIARDARRLVRDLFAIRRNGRSGRYSRLA